MRTNGRIRALIVDDEPLARRRIRRLLSGERDIEVVGECSDGVEAIGMIEELRPELVFLDVQMPKLGGLEVVEHFAAGELPIIIFVTAYDQYAIQAFEVSATDYLLKPFDRIRFTKALRRARSRFAADGGDSIHRQTLELLEHLKARTNYVERLVIKSGGRAFFLKTSEIDWIEAEGKYVRIHAGRESYLLREGIGSIEAQLDPARFPRIHRSHIVNIDRIRELQPWFHNEYRVILRDGTELMLSRSCRKRLADSLGSSL